MAVNCWVAVMAMLALPGVTATAVTVLVVTVLFVEPHPATARTDNSANTGQLHRAARRDRLDS